MFLHLSIIQFMRSEGVSLTETPRMVKGVRYASYWNAFLLNMFLLVVLFILVGCSMWWLSIIQKPFGSSL